MANLRLKSIGLKLEYFTLIVYVDFQQSKNRDEKADKANHTSLKMGKAEH